MHRDRKVKILATLGPASASPEMIRGLFLAGADVFRINMSHTSHESATEIYNMIRAAEAELDRPIGVLADLQGPKLRIGEVTDNCAVLTEGQSFVLDLEPQAGNATRAPLPHPEIFAVLKPGSTLLIDDGRIRLNVVNMENGRAETIVIVGGTLSSRKGVNVPDVVLPLSALSPKDRADLEHVSKLGVDWIALSFVQRYEDVEEARRLISGRAAVLAKIEKPSALEDLTKIIEASDAIMVARGDLGVELPVEHVPGWQKQITRVARAAGKPVVIATQMLESMIEAPIPTRAEVSDVATAVYDGADAIMLSAESASGKYPVAAVTMMNRIACRVESDPNYASTVAGLRTPPQSTPADAIAEAAHAVADTVHAAAIVSYTNSGSTGLRVARTRPLVPIIVLTSRIGTARRLSLAWGLHCICTVDVRDFHEMVDKASRMVFQERFARSGQRIVITAGVPFGTPGATNVLHIAMVGGGGQRPELP
ncbi:MAG TPA: pyruvate kinase [Alphaproteobacteria bacterium]|nr:pyruvate kinase [Alphaproteobacteria bacterium]